MRYIKDFEAGDRISGVYLCKTKQELTSSKGKPYLSLILSDKTGSVDTKVWNLTDGIEEFEAPQFVYVDGDVKLFRNENQLSLRRMRVAGEDEYVGSADAGRGIPPPASAALPITAFLDVPHPERKIPAENTARQAIVLNKLFFIAVI